MEYIHKGQHPYQVRFKQQSEIAWQTYDLNITTIFPLKEEEQILKQTQIQQFLEDQIEKKQQKKKTEKTQIAEELFYLKFDKLTNQGNATFKFSENMMDESNGFNLTLLEKGEGFIEFEIILSQETKDMIERNSLDEKDFTYL